MPTTPQPLPPPPPSRSSDEPDRVEIPVDEDEDFAAGSPRLERLQEDPEGFVVRHVENEKIVKYASGMYLCPNYVSDYLLKNLSLGEQVVFVRLYRLAGGLQKKTEGMTIGELAESVGLNPKFTATLIKSLVDKGLVKVIWTNPFLKKVRFKLTLQKEIEKKLVLCAVCHDLIHAEEDWLYYPIAKSMKGRVHAVVAHRNCVDGEPIWEGSDATGRFGRLGSPAAD